MKIPQMFALGFMCLLEGRVGASELYDLEAQEGPLPRQCAVYQMDQLRGDELESRRPVRDPYYYQGETCCICFEKLAEGEDVQIKNVCPPKKGEDYDPENREVLVIQHDDQGVITTQCDHDFHTACLFKWGKRNLDSGCMKCPLCNEKFKASIIPPPVQYVPGIGRP